MKNWTGTLFSMLACTLILTWTNSKAAGQTSNVAPEVTPVLAPALDLSTIKIVNAAGYQDAYMITFADPKWTNTKIFAYDRRYYGWTYECQTNTHGRCYYCPAVQSWFFKTEAGWGLPVATDLKTIGTKVPIWKPKPSVKPKTKHGLGQETQTQSKPASVYIQKIRYEYWPKKFAPNQDGVPPAPPGTRETPIQLPPPVGPFVDGDAAAQGPGLTVPYLLAAARR
jgi:hypothetical protein